MSESFEPQCLSLVGRMAGLRDFTLIAEDWEDPREVYRRLVNDLRPRLDQAETVLADAARLRRQARNAALRAAADASGAYDEQLAKASAGAMRREYESVKDREVLARVAAGPRFKAQRAAEAEAARVDLAWEAIRGMFYGLLNIREELLQALKHLPWEASLERT